MPITSKNAQKSHFSIKKSIKYSFNNAITKVGDLVVL